MLNAVIDISHHNSKSLNFKQAKADGILGVIHKASQGTTGPDPMFRTNRKKVHDAGLLWGAYHFASGSDGVQQAVNFLDSVGDPQDVLMVLDLEPNPTGPSMNLIEAHAFVTHVHEQTGSLAGALLRAYDQGASEQQRGPAAGQLLAVARAIRSRPRSCHRTGPRGRCGNTPTARSAAIPSRSRASAIATAIASTGPKRACAIFGTAAEARCAGALRAARRMLARAPDDLQFQPPAPAR